MFNGTFLNPGLHPRPAAYRPTCSPVQKKMSSFPTSNQLRNNPYIYIYANTRKVLIRFIPLPFQWRNIHSNINTINVIGKRISHSSYMNIAILLCCPAPNVKHGLSVVSSTHSAVVEKHPEGSLQRRLAPTRTHRLLALVRRLCASKNKKQASFCFSGKQLTKLLLQMLCVYQCPPSLQSHFSDLAAVLVKFPP